jgi:hypothetical protein
MERLQTRLQIALLVVAIALVVALAGTGVRLLQAPAPLTTGVAWAVRMAGVLAVAGGIALLVRQRRRLPPVSNRGVDPTAATIARAALIMAALALIAYLAGPRVADTRMQFMAGEEELPQDSLDEWDPGDDGASGSMRERRPQRSMLPITSRGGGGSGARQRGMPAIFVDAPPPDMPRSMLRSIAIGLLAAIVAGVIIVALRILHAPTVAPSRAEPLQVPLPDAVAALEQSLLDIVADGGDPRARITATYQRLVAAVAEASEPPQPHEAPHEYLRRSLEPLGVRPAPMHTLAELYVLAQFSRHHVGEEHCDAAARALLESLDGLRTAARSDTAADPGSAHWTTRGRA